ncbi:hypothetical protein [Flavobacterium sp.]|uniref:hypothetical protein n=1 Tax=Flavobacterium sp. TaxID=239 RepID=UPI0026038932|nr:hypothetical protein [Flavobacterium sp.]
MEDATYQLKGIARIRDLSTPYSDRTEQYFSINELRKLLSRDFYYVSAKTICAKSGKRIAIDNQMEFISDFLTRSHTFISSKEKEMTNVSANPYEIIIKDYFMVRLLRMLKKEDEILMQFLGATFAGSVDPDARLKHFNRFQGQFACLKVLATLGDNFFANDGRLRDISPQFLEQDQINNVTLLKKSNHYYVNKPIHNNTEPA